MFRAILLEFVFIAKRRTLVIPLILLMLILSIAMPIDIVKKFDSYREFLYLNTVLFVSIFIGLIVADIVRDEKSSGILENLYVYSSIDSKMLIIVRIIATVILSIAISIAVSIAMMMKYSVIDVVSLALCSTISIGPPVLFVVLSYILSPKSIRVLNSVAILSIVFIFNTIIRLAKLDIVLLSYTPIAISMSMLVIAVLIYVKTRYSIVEISIVKR